MNKSSYTSPGILEILITIWDEIEENKNIVDKATCIEKTIVYAKALSSALEQNKPAMLIDLLTGIDGEGVSPDPRFLPFIAEIIRRPYYGYVDGRKPKMTSLDQLFIYHDICKCNVIESVNLDEAYEIVGKAYGISAGTAKVIRTQHLKNPKIPKFYKRS